MDFFKKKYDAMKPAFSAVEASMKFIIFNHFEGNSITHLFLRKF
jgi:hypothetical protein